MTDYGSDSLTASVTANAVPQVVPDTPDLAGTEEGRASPPPPSHADASPSSSSALVSDPVAAERASDPTETASPDSSGSRRPTISLLSRTLEDMSPFMDEPHKAYESPPPVTSPLPGANDDTRPKTASEATPPVRLPQPPRSRTFHGSLIREGSQDSLAGMGSIRVGTSALVSALTALPWDNDTDDDMSAADEDGDAHDTARMAKTSVLPTRPKIHRLNSSLHTIRAMDLPPFVDNDDDNTPVATKSSSHSFHPHRQKLHFPFKDNTIARRARSPSKTELDYQLARKKRSEGGGGYHSGEGSHDERSPLHSGAESEPVEQPAPSDTDVEPRPQETRPESLPDLQHTDTETRLSEHTKIIRKDKLAARLQQVFGLDEQEEVLEEMNCWLLRNFMLKGYMFLTRQRICFFAHIPVDENTVIRSGPLWKKSSQTKLSTKSWFVLRNGVLSWFESSNDPYFPKGVISLQYASTCDSVGGARFKVRTTERNYTFIADTVDNAAEWVKAINKVIFKTQHEGNSVKLIIPLDAVVDIEQSPTLEFAETIEVKVVDPDDSMSVESFFFASFPDTDYAYEVLQKLLQDRPSSTLPQVPSTTTLHATADNASDHSVPRPGSSASGQFGLPKIGTVLRPLGLGGEREGKASSDSRVPIAAPPKPTLPHSHSDTDFVTSESEASDYETSGPKGYPPKQSGPPPPSMEPASSWRGGSWIRNPAAKLFGTSPSSAELGKRFSINQDPPRRPSNVTVVVEGALPNSDDEASDHPSNHRLHPASTMSSTMTISSGQSKIPHLKSSQSGFETVDDNVSSKFHSYFALPEKEELIADCSGSLYRVIPVHGRFYISTNYFCFRSNHLLYKTKMIVPIRDLFGMKAQKAFRFAHSGLIVIIKGHEELFLEFSSSKRRNDCMSLLEDRMEALREGNLPSHTPDEFPETIMEDLDESLWCSGPSAASLPSPMFGSAASSFLEFKPEPMTIVCLTIGSRGDVQPYIALCKGLQAEGHCCKIATHGEYKDWVEAHGIGFASVGGDPAELMRLCVDNGMFTVSFVKESLGKFRAWFDDLLTSSWAACQGADLLIESPSAMAGVHIAEALQIPFYRAFTMPWTRTRSYPHAFAVPEHKRGGSYNYMTYVMFDQIFWRAMAGQVNRWRKNELHLDATTLDKLHADKIPFLYNFSPTVVPPPLDWTEWIHVTGYWFLDHADGPDRKAWTPPEGVVEFIDAAHARGKKVVYIGFGSIVVSDPHEMTRCVVEAIVQADVCAILSKGWSDRGNEAASKGNKDGADGIEYPDSIFAIDAIDHSWLFPRIDAACHHGGAGTTGASLRAGIPTLIKPFFGDQAFWAERVESLGVGAAIRKLTSESLATALREATTNERQITRAKAVGEAIRKENGVQRAIEAIYRDLEYAKAIIKPLPGASDTSLVRKVSHFGLHSVPPGTPRKSKSLREPRSEGHGRAHGHSHSRSRGISTDREGGPGSDESWSVVSDSGHASQMNSPAIHISQLHDGGSDPSTHSCPTPAEGGSGSGGAGRRESSFAALGNLMGHWLPKSATPRGPPTPEPAETSEDK